MFFTFFLFFFTINYYYLICVLTLLRIISFFSLFFHWNLQDAMAIQQRNEYEQVINERDILGTQLIRRNDELALLYEKIKIQQSTLKKGEAQYQERLNDLRVLKLKVKDVMRELMISKKQGACDFFFFFFFFFLLVFFLFFSC